MIENNGENVGNIKEEIMGLSSVANSILAHIDTIRSNQASGGKNYEANMPKIKELRQRLQAIGEQLQRIR